MNNLYRLLDMRFKKIGLAIAFSPRAEALLAEAARLKKLFNSELVLIHVGVHGQAEEDTVSTLLSKVNLTLDDVTLCWREGKPAKEIIKACTEQGIDLLIAGALTQDGIVQHYLGSVARKILRKAKCSVLTLTNPDINSKPFSNIVVNAEDSPYLKEAVAVACELGMRDNSKWLQVVREIKLYGLTMSSADQATEEEYIKIKQNLTDTEVDNVQRMLSAIPHEGLKVNIKIISGKSGFELAKFTKRKQADLLVVGAPPTRLMLIDRLFPHDLEYIFADLPCNLLIVNPGKENDHG